MENAMNIKLLTFLSCSTTCLVLSMPTLATAATWSCPTKLTVYSGGNFSGGTCYPTNTPLVHDPNCAADKIVSQLSLPSDTYKVTFQTENAGKSGVQSLIGEFINGTMTAQHGSKGSDSYTFTFNSSKQYKPLQTDQTYLNTGGVKGDIQTCVYIYDSKTSTPIGLEIYYNYTLPTEGVMTKSSI
jgi:hypothetical protein